MKPIQTNDAPGAVGPYSQAVNKDGWVYCSGQIPLDPASGKLVEGSISDQTHQVMRNLKAVLQAADAHFGHVVQTTIFLRDMADFKAVNEVYTTYLSEPFPARATVAVSGLPLGAQVEISMVAKV